VTPSALDYLTTLASADSRQPTADSEPEPERSEGEA